MEKDNSSSQRRVALASVDRLSSLPPELINKILKRLPIRDVVQTSVLSRFWRCRWMLIQDLVFDARSIPPSRQGHSITKLPDFINHVLLLHNENVSRFEISNYLDCYYPDVGRWLHLLARKSVKKLILEFPSPNCPKLSSSLFSCQNLRKLKLQGCVLCMPSYIKGLPSLVDLELIKVTFTVETIASLIVNCPLTRLTLIYCDGFNRINIYAPALQALFIHGPCESVNFGNAPDLEYAYMHFWPSAGQIQVPTHNGRKLNFKDVLGGLVDARKLDLNNSFIKILVSCMVPGKLPIKFTHLSNISMGLNLDDAEQILTAVKLLKTSPQLLTITINNCSMEKSIPLKEGVSLQRQLQQGGCTFPSLETVALSGFKGRMYELIFLRYLLSRAGALQTVSIEWEVTCFPNDQGKAPILEKMLQFERASPRAKLVFVRKYNQRQAAAV